MPKTIWLVSARWTNRTSTMIINTFNFYHFAQNRRFYTGNLPCFLRPIIKKPFCTTPWIILGAYLQAYFRLLLPLRIQDLCNWRLYLYHLPHKPSLHLLSLHNALIHCVFLYILYISSWFINLLSKSLHKYYLQMFFSKFIYNSSFATTANRQSHSERPIREKARHAELSQHDAPMNKKPIYHFTGIRAFESIINYRNVIQGTKSSSFP